MEHELSKLMLTSSPEVLLFRWWRLAAGPMLDELLQPSAITEWKSKMVGKPISFYCL